MSEPVVPDYAALRAQLSVGTYAQVMGLDLIKDVKATGPRGQHTHGDVDRAYKARAQQWASLDAAHSQIKMVAPRAGRQTASLPPTPSPSVPSAPARVAGVSEQTMSDAAADAELWAMGFRDNIEAPPQPKWWELFPPEGI